MQATRDDGQQRDGLRNVSEKAFNRRKYKTVSKSAQSRMLILDAAARIFGRKGYSETSLREIAEAAGMQAGSLYYHFASKEEIFDEVLSTGMRNIHEKVACAVFALEGSASHRQRIECAITAHLELLLTDSDYYRVACRLLAQAPEPLASRHREFRIQYGRLWDCFLREAQKAGEIRKEIKIIPLRMLIVGALNWTLEWFDIDNHPIEQFVRQVSMTVFDGAATVTARTEARTRRTIRSRKVREPDPTEQGRRRPVR
jgi:AcrR family transcriptional regulator